MRVAIVHDWLTGMRGGERVLEALLELFPQAEIFTLLHVPGSVSASIEARPIHTSFVNRLPAVRTRYRYYLPLFPRAVESLDLSGFELIISSSHCVAKGAQPPAGVPHLCYCHTPMRYVWDQYDAYFGPGRSSLTVRTAMRWVAPRLRRWDAGTAGRVTRFLANSRYIRRRIRDYYGRDAGVVHPPVSVESFAPRARRGEHYVIIGPPVPYKRVELALEAFRDLRRPLLVVGDGVGAGAGVADLRRRAPGNVDFLGRVSDAELAEVLGTARGLIMAGVEDFGIGVVEALASGCPVVALGKGGVFDTVEDLGDPSRRGPATGVFFHEATPEALVRAVETLEAHEWDPEAIARSARPFAKSRFLEEMRRETEGLMAAVRRAGTAE